MSEFLGYLIKLSKHDNFWTYVFGIIIAGVTLFSLSPLFSTKGAQNVIQGNSVPVAPAPSTPTPVSEIEQAQNNVRVSNEAANNALNQMYRRTTEQYKVLLILRAYEWQRQANTVASQRNISLEQAYSLLPSTQIQDLQNNTTSLEDNSYRKILFELQAIKLAQTGKLPELGIESLPNPAQFQDQKNPVALYTEVSEYTNQMAIYNANNQVLQQQIINQARQAESTGVPSNAQIAPSN